MRISLLLLLLAGCATTPTRHAETFLKRGHVFTGDRWVTLMGSDDDVSALETILITRGFRISRGVPGVKTRLPVRWVAHIKGTCATRWGTSGGYTGIPEIPGMRIDVFDTDSDERVFSARLDDEADCPRAFFAEFGEALVRNWE